MIPLEWYLILSAVIFSIGLYGVLARRNAIAIMMCLELMMTSITINLVAFWRYGNVIDLSGQVFAVIVFAVAAAEATVGLALAISIYRNRDTIVANDLNLLKW